MADWKVRRVDEDLGLQLGERRVQRCRAHAKPAPDSSSGRFDTIIQLLVHEPKQFWPLRSNLRQRIA